MNIIINKIIKVERERVIIIKEINKIISVSKIKKIILIRKNCILKNKYLEERKSNPLLKKDIFS